jgi:hypothetical protein
MRVHHHLLVGIDYMSFEQMVYLAKCILLINSVLSLVKLRARRMHKIFKDNPLKLDLRVATQGWLKKIIMDHK